MPPEEVDAIEAKYPGFLARRLAVNTSRMYAQLSKRYDVPFRTAPPEIALGWVVAMTDPDMYRRRGWAPAEEQSLEIEQLRKDALAEIQLAADAQNGLFDLPLLEDSNETGISRGDPFGYSEPSPYDWLDVQAEALRGR